MSAGPAGGFRIGDGYVSITARDLTAEGRQRAQRSIQSLNDRRLKIDADTSAVNAEIARTRQKLNDLGSQTPSPKVQLDTAAAQARLAQLQARLQSLRNQRVEVDVDADTALRRLALIQANAHRAEDALNGFSLGARDAGAAGLQGAGGMGMLGTALAVLPAVAGAAGAALAALPAIIATIGSSVGVIGLAFNGIGAALQGYESDQNAAAAAGNSAADTARANARAIRDATAAIEDAKRNQARVARDTAEQIQAAEEQVQAAIERVAEAQANLADVQEQAGKDAVRAARAVADAQDALVEAQQHAARAAERAADAVATASRRVTDAQKREQTAQQGLNDAREKAIRQLRDLAEKASDAALDQEGAAIALLEAQQQLAKVNDDVTSSELDKRKALYAVAQAQDRLDDANQAALDATKENNDAQAKGVEGSDLVVGAKDRLADATEATADAEKSLANAQRDAADQAVESAKSIADAQRRVTDAQQAQADQAEESAKRIADAQKRVVDAQKGVADAEKNLAKTRQRAAEANEDAARRVADAEQRLNDILEDQAAAAAKAAGGAHAFADAMNKLSPAAQLLVKQLIAMKPAIKSLQDVAAGAFLPGVTQMLKDSTALFPIFERSLGRTGQAMGQTARDMGALFKSVTFQQDLQQLLDSTVPITASIGRLMVNLTRDFVSFGAAMAPVSAAVSRFFDLLSGGLTGLFSNMRPYAQDFAAMWDGLGMVFGNLLPILGTLIGEFTRAFVPVLQTVAQWINNNRQAIEFWLPAIAQVATAFMVWKGINLILSPLTGALTSAGAALTGMAARAGATSGFVSGAGAALSALGKALPVIGIAAIAASEGLNQANSATANAAKGFVLGGDAAKKASDDYFSFGNVALNSVLLALPGVSAGVDNLGVKMAQAGSSLTPLEKAQRDYNQAVADFGKDSPQAVDSLSRLNTEAQKADLAQRAAAAGTDEHTMALKDLAGQMQTALGADIGYEQSLLRVKDAQKDLAAAIRDHGAGSDQAVESELRLRAAVEQSAEAAQRKAEADAKAAGVVDTTRIGIDAYNTSLLAQAANMDGPAQAALLKYAGKMTDAQLATYSAASEASGFATKVLTLPDGRKVTITLDPAQALAGLANTESAINNTTATLKITGDPALATQEKDALLATINASSGTVDINGQSMRAGDALTAVLAQINAGAATVTIDGQTVPADKAREILLKRISDSNAPVTIDGVSYPAGQVLDAFITRTEGSRPNLHIEGDTNPAKSAFQILWDGWAGRVLTWIVNTVGGNANGALMAPMADGGILTRVARFAGGGMAMQSAEQAMGHHLTPMSSSVARMVPPNTWRVIGDNMSVPELFAPLDGSQRSLNLIAAGAGEFGYGLTPLGGDGAATPSTSAIVAPAAVTVGAAAPAAVGASSGSGGSRASGGVDRSVVIRNLNISALIDFRDKSLATRQVTVAIREALRRLDNE